MPRFLWVLSFIALFIGSTCIFEVDETEVAIVTQFGEYKWSVTTPGLHYKKPWPFHEVTRMDSRVLVSDVPAAEYLTQDKKRLVADPITRWRISDPLIFYKNLGTVSGARARLDDIVASELRRELASHEFDEIVGNARTPMMNEVADNTREQTGQFGVEIVDVRIVRADLPKEVQESVFQRMRAERERKVAMYRSEGAEQAARIRAQADKERTIILAEAYAASEKIRGEGDAESTRQYAAAFSKDSEYYSFIRGLDAYERSMGSKTRLVLSTKSELFRHFMGPQRTAGR